MMASDWLLIFIDDESPLAYRNWQITIGKSLVPTHHWQSVGNKIKSVTDHQGQNVIGEYLKEIDRY